jgi:hypothetical protein
MRIKQVNKFPFCLATFKCDFKKLMRSGDTVKEFDRCTFDGNCNNKTKEFYMVNGKRTFRKVNL